MKVVNLSSLVEIKGIKYFVLSHKYIQHKKNINYELYGDGQLRGDLILSRGVSLMGFSREPDKVIESSDVLVISSIIPEAAPLVALESFRYGKPVIATNLGGQAEIVIDNYVGLHCLPKNPQSIAEKIDLLYENPELYNRLSRNALEYSKKFSYEKFRSQILEVFDSVMKK